MLVRRWVTFLLLIMLITVWRPAVLRGDASLTMEQAIRMAIEKNLTTRIAKAGTEEARGQALQAAAGLLPKITGSLQQSRVFKVNFEAQGFPSGNPAFNPLVGPFNSFDARLQLVQALLDMSAIWKMQAGRAGERIAALQEKLAREQVATAAALAYLEAQRAQRAVGAAEADLKLSESLYKLAYDQHQAGVSTGVDVARAETSRAQENLRLIRAHLAVTQADVRLKRVVGLPLDQPLTLPDIPRAVAADFPGVEKALAAAQNDRFELQLAKENVVAATDLLKSSKAEYWPTIKAMGDYGHSGNLPAHSARTGSIGGRLDLPIFSGGAIHGRTVEDAGRQEEAQARYTDISTQIEEDIRLALQTLAAEIEETRTADRAIGLAQKELKMAKDRFSAGVGDNIQVLNAQTSLARAWDEEVEAFARYDQARVNLATALGRMQDFK